MCAESTLCPFSNETRLMLTLQTNAWKKRLVCFDSLIVLSTTKSVKYPCTQVNIGVRPGRCRCICCVKCVYRVLFSKPSCIFNISLNYTRSQIKSCLKLFHGELLLSCFMPWFINPKRLIIPYAYVPHCRLTIPSASV